MAINRAVGNCDPTPWYLAGITVQEAGAAMHVSRRTIYHWIENNHVRWARTAGGSIRIDPASLMRHPDQASSGELGKRGSG